MLQDRSIPSLAWLARALGGETYDRGTRANVPAPGHSAADRSVSLRLVGGRLIVHSFGAADWREVLDHLRGHGWIDADNRLIGVASTDRSPRAEAPTARERTAAAQRLWAGGGPILPDSPAARYCAARRAELGRDQLGALRGHAAAPQAVYRDRGPYRPALLAAVVDPLGRFTACEVTYLDAAGRRSRLASPARKLVGVLPPGSAVRFTACGPSLLVAEGVFTTLSAMVRFQLPGWALLSTSNLRRWTPPEGVRRVLIAADRGADGERSAERLRRELIRRGVGAGVRLPPPAFGDWDDLAQSEGESEGGSGRPDRKEGA